LTRPNHAGAQKIDSHLERVHFGRRTFITNAARKISTVGGSLRDIQLLAGHSNLTTTQRYIESHAEAQRKIVELV
jgi:integrase/recombinase XerD